MKVNIKIAEMKWKKPSVAELLALPVVKKQLAGAVCRPDSIRGLVNGDADFWQAESDTSYFLGHHDLLTEIRLKA